MVHLRLVDNVTELKGNRQLNNYQFILNNDKFGVNILIQKSWTNKAKNSFLII